MNISKALSIDGWMLENELIYLAELASKSLKIAEIGSWMGRSTMALACNTNGIVTAIDTWKGSDEAVHINLLGNHDKDWLLNQFKNNIADTPNIEIVQMESLQAAEYLSGRKFDLIFIDATHECESVKNDIIVWSKLLEPGGIICGHDYNLNWPGVIKAVDSNFSEVSLVGSIWTPKIR